MRQASVLVADDMTYSLNGKMNLTGIYSGDIIIPNPRSYIQQLVFLFTIDTDVDDLFERIEVSIKLPSGDKRVLEIPLRTLIPTLSDKIRWNTKTPLLFQNTILSPGPIEAKIIHEKGEMLLSAPVIALPLVLPAVGAATPSP
jgi:hypothetical protein